MSANLTIGTTPEGKSVSIPASAAGQALAFIGIRGSGKTYGATKLAEQMHAAGIQIVAIDPVGVWYGLRLAADGKGKGLDIVIFGGLHGDIPLQPNAGTLIADVIVSRNISAVIDVSQFESDTDKARFARDFAARFFFLKKSSPSRVHVFVEEAQEFIPQNLQRGEEQMLHAWQRMIRLGRNFQIGATMISQRPQDVNKKALNQAEWVFAFKLQGTQERRAVSEWIEGKGLNTRLINELPTFTKGSAYIWGPEDGIIQIAHIDPKQTFAAGGPQSLTGIRAEPKPLAGADLDKLRASMAAMVEEAKANDPRELRAQIAKLKKESAQKSTAKTAPMDSAQIERAVTKAIADRDKHWDGIIKIHLRAFRDLQGTAIKSHKLLTDAIGLALPSYELPLVETPKAVTSPRVLQPSPRPAPVRVANGDGAISNPEQRVLDAILWFNEIGIERPDKQQVAFIAGYTITKVGGTYGNLLGGLRSKGFIEYPAPGFVTLTSEGCAIAGDPGVEKTSDGLQSAIMSRLENTECRVLTILIQVYPESLDKIELAERSGYQVTKVGGTFGNILGRLRSLGLIEYPRPGVARAKDLLFVD